VVDYGVIEWLRPEYDPSRGTVDGTLHQLSRVFLHFDFGEACMFPGCPPVTDLWERGWQVDVWLLAGGLLLGVGGGILGGVACALRPRSLVARAVEWVGMVLFCTPPYVLGLGLLLLFAPVFGIWQAPWFFEPGAYQAPTEDFWDFLRSMLVPWLILAAPVAAACLRLTLALVLDDLEQDYVRTGVAKGLRRWTVIRRHAAPPAYPGVASFVAISVPAVVTNAVLVEWVFSVPGFFRHTKRATGKAVPQTIDIPTLQALAMWGAVLIVVVGLLADVAIALLDPRVRARR
jgi:peptide/nickel transport system permease protein